MAVAVKLHREVFHADGLVATPLLLDLPHARRRIHSDGVVQTESADSVAAVRVERAYDSVRVCREVGSADITPT